MTVAPYKIEDRARTEGWALPKQSLGKRRTILTGATVGQRTEYKDQRI